MLTKLTLTDFKRHKNLEINFTDGLTLVSGPNYSGKTTILQGIMYALWGPSAIPGGTAVVTRRGGKTARAELEFPHDGNAYSVARAGGSATVTKNGEVVAKSASAVSSYLTELLGIDKKRFSQLRYSRQGETQALLTLGAGEIHSIIEELSGVAIVNEVAAKAKTIAAKETALAEAKKVEYLETRRKEMLEMSGELRFEMGNIKALKDDHAALKQALIKANNNYHAAVETNEKAAKVESDIRDLDTKIAGAQERIDRLSSEILAAKGLGEELEGVEVVSDALSGELMGAADVAAYLTKVHVSLPSAEHARDKANEVAEEAINAAAESVDKGPTEDDLATQRKNVEAALEERARTKAEYKAALQVVKDGKCPTCGAAYDDCDDNAEFRAEELGVVAEEAAEFYEAGKLFLEVVEKEMMVTNKLLKTLADAEQAKDLAERAVEDLDMEIGTDPLHGRENLPDVGEVSGPALAEKREELNGLLQKKADITSAIAAAKKAEVSVSALEEKIGRYTAEKTALGEEVVRVDLSVIKLEVKEATSAAEASAATISQLNGMYSEKFATYTALKAEVSRDTDRDKESKEHASKAAVATELAKYLAKNRDRFMSAAWGSIMAVASEFASACTGGEVSSVDRSPKGDFTYTEGEEVMPIEAASGAQKSIIGLGVQMAMSKLMPGPVNTLLLDEVTADMDAEKSLTLSTVVKSNGGQVLMVSHRELDGSSAENVISLEP